MQGQAFTDEHDLIREDLGNYLEFTAESFEGCADPAFTMMNVLDGFMKHSDRLWVVGVTLEGR